MKWNDDCAGIANAVFATLNEQVLNYDTEEVLQTISDRYFGTGRVMTWEDKVNLANKIRERHTVSPVQHIIALHMLQFILDRSEYGTESCKQCTAKVKCTKHLSAYERTGIWEDYTNVVHFALKGNAGTVCATATVNSETTEDRDAVTCRQCLIMTTRIEEKYDIRAMLFSISPSLWD